MSLLKDLVQVSIHNRNVSTLNQALTIVFPDIVKDKEFIIHEYDGDVPRLFGTDNTIELMLPNDMDTVVENAVVDAIATGTLFDDANTVKNTCDYIAMTQLPTIGMTNRGFDRPAVLKYSMGPVVGAMNHEGRFGNDETDIQNGINFTKDVIDHGNDDNINDLIGSYIDAKDSGKLSLKFRKATRGIDDEIKNINSVEPSDTLTVNDIDDGFGDGESKAKDIDDDDFESKNDDIDDIDECGECGDVDTFDEDGDWASNIMSEVKKQTASKDAELDDIIAKNKQDQDDMQKRVAEMRARVMARRNGNASSWAEETGEIESGESDNTPTEGSSTMTEQEICDKIYDEYIQEGLFKRPKKLKPIPRDVVAYITVEINAIKDANDQAMLASYTCAKLELVDFYITCIDTKDERYIVPHTRQYLVQMQTDLNRLLTRILQIKPINHNDRMWKAILTPGGVY
jgi:hypothetical protein